MYNDVEEYSKKIAIVKKLCSSLNSVQIQTSFGH